MRLNKQIAEVTKFVKKNKWTVFIVTLILLVFVYQNKPSANEFFGGRESANLYGGSSGVAELSLSDFNLSGDPVLNKYVGKKGLVVFYAPWCPHCKSMVSDYSKLVDIVNKSRNFVAAVNCEKQKELGNKCGVKSYPTLMMVDEGGNLRQYKGARGFDDLKMLIL